MKKSVLLMLLAVAAFGMSGCDSDGPAERAGESVDNAVDSMKDKASDAGDSLSETVKDACDEVGDATDSNVDC
jgi:hypothetical protein